MLLKEVERLENKFYLLRGFHKTNKQMMKDKKTVGNYQI